MKKEHETMNKVDNTQEKKKSMIPGMAIHSFFQYQSSPHHIFFPLSI